ncbi:hypothetical protein SAMN04488065_1845 [Haloplanus vescus]|uniref:Uncharacterized protein n=1 Tax=Haloplanus vescus TaxID=555874 RepID=A0A1H3YF89_9EURY|nr:hypothetical protein [Haloplanus vescus]SEA10217.1 hypothetical protein SAMN04488065_1845 [Haloplanus vescus]
MQRHQLGQALIGVACALFVGGAVALVAGLLGAGAVVPIGVVALGCLGLGGALAMPE